MWKLMALVLFVCFLCSGCRVSEIEVSNNIDFKSYNGEKTVLKIALLDRVSFDIEQFAEEFEAANSEIRFKFLRLPDDEKYRFSIFDLLAGKEINAFCVRNLKDVEFLKDYIGSFAYESYFDRISFFSDCPCFKISQHVNCLWYNEPMLDSIGIDISSLNSLSALELAVKKAEILKKTVSVRDVVSKGCDLCSIACSVAFKAGHVSSDLKKLVDLVGNGAYQDPNDALFGKKCVFYFGSDRFFDLKLKNFYSDIIKSAPMPFEKGTYKIREVEYLCIGNNLKTLEKEKLLNFLDFASARAKENLKGNEDFQNGSFALFPVKWLDGFNENMELLRNDDIGWEEFQKNLIVDWNVFSKY